MGEHDVKDRPLDEDELRVFTKALLDDVHALERMLDGDWFEENVRRVGAEQEMFLVDDAMRPACVASEVLARAGDPRLTTELARFNLEANLSPRTFGGRCLSELEAELDEVLEVARRAAAEAGADVVLTGTLPTLRKVHTSLEHMTPDPRYHALNQAICNLRGGELKVSINGLDELELVHDNVMYEACNTSFQVHFQVGPSEFARLYNVAQAVTAPVLAAAVNSPLFLGRRLWHETRVALFQTSIDSRPQRLHERGNRPRVSFGDRWVDASVLEIFREDIARFRILLSRDLDEPPDRVLARGDVPALSALRLHNGTVYRWNRACYGQSGTRAHLRIENRVLPAGPTPADEVANAAFYFGLMSAFLAEYGDVARVMLFDDAKNNFFAAARHGLNAQFNWVGGETHAAPALILDQLLPMAREGLEDRGLDARDIDRYLGIIEERVRRKRTGAAWMLRSLQEMQGVGTRDLRERRLVKEMRDLQRRRTPVHLWPLARLDPGEAWAESYRTVDQVMSTDLITVRSGDLVDYAASLMDWERLRHVPVEDDQGRLVGLLSHRAVLRLVSRGTHPEERLKMPVKSLMKTDLVTVAPDTPTLECIETMKQRRVGCLPVVEDGHLVGMLTEADLVAVSIPLLQSFLRPR